MSGHVRDAATNAPLGASVTVKNVAYTMGETNASSGPFGRWHAFLPAGRYTIAFAAPGHRAEEREVTVAAGAPVTLDVALAPQ